MISVIYQECDKQHMWRWQSRATHGKVRGVCIAQQCCGPEAPGALSCKMWSLSTRARQMITLVVFFAVPRVLCFAPMTSPLMSSARYGTSILPPPNPFPNTPLLLFPEGKTLITRKDGLKLPCHVWPHKNLL